ESARGIFILEISRPARYKGLSGGILVHGEVSSVQRVRQAGVLLRRLRGYGEALLLKIHALSQRHQTAKSPVLQLLCRRAAHSRIHKRRKRRSQSRITKSRRPSGSLQRRAPRFPRDNQITR